MRARLTALIILFLLIGGPIAFYWYFYKQNITSIVFLSETNEPFTVSLDGKLEYEYFPLLDEAFRYKSTCSSSCIFSPIPPITYSIRISSNGREDIIDTVSLKKGEQFRYAVKLPKILSIEKIGSIAHSIPPSPLPGYISIGVTPSGKIIATDDKRDGGQVGVINGAKFITLFRTAQSLESAYMDQTRNYVIVPDRAKKQSLYPLDQGNLGIVFPFPDKILSVTSTAQSWKVRTQEHLYEFQGGIWKKNPRFTDYIDLSQRYRLGFISAIQKDKLQLQNYTPGTSVMVLLDRLSTDTIIMKRGLEVEGMFFLSGVPAYLDTDGNIYRLELRGFSQ